MAEYRSSDCLIQDMACPNHTDDGIWPADATKGVYRIRNTQQAENGPATDHIPKPILRATVAIQIQALPSATDTSRLADPTSHSWLDAPNLAEKPRTTPPVQTDQSHAGGRRSPAKFRVLLINVMVVHCGADAFKTRNCYCTVLNGVLMRYPCCTLRMARRAGSAAKSKGSAKEL